MPKSFENLLAQIPADQIQPMPSRRTKEMASARAHRLFTIHGACSHRLGGSYASMRQRCSNPNDQAYANYGGRGIKVHQPWLDDPWRFFAYVETLPHYGEEGRSLDRIDNDGHYEPGNLRWATAFEQMNNMRANRWHTRSDGRVDTRTGWSRFLGSTSPSLVYSRLQRGWTEEEALWTPKGKRRRTS